MRRLIFVFALGLNTLLAFPQSLPTPTITVQGSATVCPYVFGGFAFLASSASTGNVWSNGDTGQYVMVHAPGTFYVTQVIGNNSSLPSAPVTVYIYPMTSASVVPAGPFCNNSPTVELQAFPVGGIFVGPGMSDSTVFTPADANIGNNNIIYYEYSQVFGTVTCFDTAACRITVNSCVTGLHENTLADAGVLIYPSGSPGQFEVQSPSEKIRSLRVLELSGKQILSAGAENNNMNFDLSAYPQGIYIAELQLETRLTRLRIAKTE